MSGSDKYAATWVSHSSMGDFIACPRAYFLHNMYRNEHGHKITIVNPLLSLGQVVHTTLEDLKYLPVHERLERDLHADFDRAWGRVSGVRGGFKNSEEEETTKARGRAMIERVKNNLGPIARKTVKLRPAHNNMPPNIVLSEEDNIVLCGMVDWIEYIEEDDSVRILDFKTGKHEEKVDSLQLPIYVLLLHELQPRRVSGAAYWYLEYDDAPKTVALPEIHEARERVLTLARQITKARAEHTFHCPHGMRGCFTCRPYESIISGNARYVGVVGYGQDAYMI